MAVPEITPQPAATKGGTTPGARKVKKTQSREKRPALRLDGGPFLSPVYLPALPASMQLQPPQGPEQACVPEVEVGQLR